MGFNSIDVHFQSIRSVFQLITIRTLFVREFSRFSNGDKANSQLQRQRSRDQKAPGLRRRNHVDIQCPKVVSHSRNGFAERRKVTQQWRDVFEHNPRLREIGHIPNKFFQVHGRRIGHNQLLAIGSKVREDSQ